MSEASTVAFVSALGVAIALAVVTFALRGNWGNDELDD